MGTPTSGRGPHITPPPGRHDAGWRAPTARATGAVASSTSSPADFSLRLVTGELALGAALTFDANHGDEVLYVLTGALDVDGRLARRWRR